jgi:hypothetical protein
MNDAVANDAGADHDRVGSGREGARLRLVRQEITSYHTLRVGKRRLALRR